MSLLENLQQLVQTGAPISGRVISVSGTKAIVATASGQMEVSANGNLQPGDQVTIEAGTATKKQRGGEATVYFV
jgi:hypothetical protein